MSLINFHHSDRRGQLDLLAELEQEFRSFREIVILCIGTDRSAGDSMGPLVGTMLMELYNGACVYGTLENPVHAKNLEEVYQDICRQHPDAYILAIDACLGSIRSVGSISFRREPLRPGLAVKKELITVGHASLIGVVNIGGFMEYLTLQNTRLDTTYRLAKVISGTVAQALIGRVSFQAVSATYV
ncbi:MAG: spore protease YyaC [Clostridia bacterium]|nr:spore protease YyaC [Clostridia bacterium]